MPTEPQDIGFPQLGEGEPFRLVDGDLKLLSRESRVQSPVILAAQVRVGVSELNHAVEPTGALKDRGVEAGGVIGGGNYDHPILRPHTVKAVEQGLEAHGSFLCALPLRWKSAVKVFEDYQSGGIGGSIFEETQNIGTLLFQVAQVECIGLNVRTRRHHPQSRGLAVARRPPEKVSASIRQIVLVEPAFPLKEKLEITSHHTACGRIHDHGIPVISPLKSRPSLCSFQISLRLILYLLLQQQHLCSILTVHDEPVLS